MEKDELLSRVRKELDDVMLSRKGPYELDADRIEDVYISLVKIRVFLRKMDIEINLEEYEGHYGRDNERLRATITNVRAHLAAYEVEQQETLSTVGVYELSQNDVRQIQIIIDECRKTIVGSKNLNPHHKQRVQSRLEKIQIEIHKVRTDLDITLASIKDISDATKHAGENIKPFTDRMKAIFDAIMGRETAPPQLPAPPKQLPAPDDTNK